MELHHPCTYIEHKGKMLHSYGFELRNVVAKDAGALYGIEKDSYPPDESATLEKIADRIEIANEFFLACMDPSKAEDNQGKYIGFVNGTCIIGNSITHDSMSNHEATGRTLVSSLLPTMSICKGYLSSF